VTTDAEESPLLRFVKRTYLGRHCRGIAIVQSSHQVTTSESGLRRQCGLICNVELSNNITDICSYNV
jgi:hypothetical protein